MGPQLKVVERTRTATMLCAASGFPDPVISWFKDFLPVEPSASSGRIKLLRSGEQRRQIYLALLIYVFFYAILILLANWETGCKWMLGSGVMFTNSWV